MDLSNLPDALFHTRQESVFYGATHTIPLSSLGEWCTPQVLIDPSIKVKPTISEVQAERRKLGWVSPGMMAFSLKAGGFIPNEGDLVISLQDLDPETGMTVKDPKAEVGVWDEKAGILRDGNDVTPIIKRFFKEKGIGIPFRTEAGELERESRRRPEGGY